MDKEQILSKAKKDYKNGDERTEFITNKSFSYGAIGMAVTFFILIFIRMANNNGDFNDLAAMYTSFMMAHYLYKFRVMKHKDDKILLICWTIMTASNILLYVWKG